MDAARSGASVGGSRTSTERLGDDNTEVLPNKKREPGEVQVRLHHEVPEEERTALHKHRRVSGEQQPVAALHCVRVICLNNFTSRGI